jgi:pyruvate formate lyase activating enzyme
MSDRSQVARYWEACADQVAVCRLCPHHCRIKAGQRGLCRARRNETGTLIADSYAKVTALSLDPIEKKPLHAFHPGSRILSVGSFGCNFRCGFCQNWSIAQEMPDWQRIEPDELVAQAVRARGQGNIGLAYTYNEPLVGFEYVSDCARLARAAGLINVLVTNGFVDPEPLADLLPWIDAMNIDLKAWQASFYRSVCGGEREPVLRTIARAAAVCHVEITTLLIPGLNDAKQDIDELACWLGSIDRRLVLHLTRHHPDYHMSEPPPINRADLLERVSRAARWLDTVIPGNI